MPNLQSTRDLDNIIEREINAFNDKHLYGKGIYFTRERNRNNQLNGIDGYISVPELGIEKAPCDEKASGQYVNKPLPTFLMELSQVTANGDVVDGWFLNEDNKTEYYMLMYLWATVPQTVTNEILNAEWSKINRKNITLIEYILVEKQKIKEYLKECGFDENRLRNGANYIREHDDTDSYKTKHGFKFVISRNLKECPVNLCINRSVYLKLCAKHGYASQFD